MSTEPPPNGSGQPPDDDPFRKPPPATPGGGSPYDSPQDPQGAGGQSPYDAPQNPYGGTPPPGGGTPPPYDGGTPPPYDGGTPPPPGGGTPPPYGGGTPPPYGGDPYGGGFGAGDPLAGMPPLADSGKRVLARIIDLILVGIVAGLLTWAFGISEYETDPDKIEYGKQFGQSLLAAVLYIGYDTIMMAKTGQTFGKKLMKLRLANLDNGATPSVQTNLIRAVVLWIPAVFCCACIWTAICGGWSFFDKPYKQGLHDKAAKTVVVSSA
ncbi:RDD family protein [Streptomyces sp. SID14478]|uniref:RDD family protein n=1 Tax=Streptomyces sp. SID14478 TaxID=2706073 RepID=UPI0013DC6935|nr:RDD family protein [Streptomyces sp. SID14478]NEB74593.1 RDD family protein [Streptomyces sp. SID14478]